MYMTNNENQEYNEFMSKLANRLIKLNLELQEDYNKLSPNAKIMADKARQNILKGFAQAQNFNDMINTLNSFRK